MFESIQPQKADAVMTLMGEFHQDRRTDKIDLGVGVYRDEHGHTPIMKAISEAQKKLLETETSKCYLGLLGDEGFNCAIQSFILSGTSADNRAKTLQTPGGGGATRILADLVVHSNPNATVWISNPAYVNHKPIMTEVGLKVRDYPYLNPQTNQVDESAMLETVAGLGKDDVLLLHGCCHNPTGADISLEAWQTIADLANKNGFLPFVDFAYHGFGDSLEEDARGVRLLADQVEEMLLASSCSKNFGLYRERTGAATVITKTHQQAVNTRSKMCQLARVNYTMPPATGASLVRMILEDNHLFQLWRDELTAMNTRMKQLRHELVKEFQQKTQTQNFDFFAQHKGMFSVTGFSSEMLEYLKVNQGIYIVSDGRINIAGMHQNDIPRIVEAVINYHE